MSLFWRVFFLNAVVLTTAMVLLLFGPITVSTPVLLAEALIVITGLVVMLVANAAMLRIGLAPVERLARTMTTVDLLRPGQRPTLKGRGGIADLIKAFNAMLDRLEAERAASSGRALSAQEAERQRVGQELHDEVGQTLTAILLELKRVSDRVPEPMGHEIRQIQETVRGSLDEIRRIARRLRPGVLEELGLVSALKALAAEFSQHDGLSVRHRFDTDMPHQNKDTELVVYRVAQESLTNVARHAQATHVELALCRSRSGIDLYIRDNGRGLGASPEGAGIRGMRERALLIGADLTVRPAPHEGTEVRLRLPARQENI